MSRSLLEPLKSLFSPPRPHWACEFTAKHLIVSGVDSSRKRVVGSLSATIPPGAVSGTLSDRNLPNPQGMRDLIKETLHRAGFRGFEISVVIPDDSTRITFLTVEGLSGTDDDRETFVRWKLKKTVPFDVDAAQVAYKVIGPHQGSEGKGLDIMVALSPRAIVREYEELFESLDLHAGLVLPSTLAAINMFQPPADDVLFVKVAPDSVTTTVFQKQLPRFYRRVAEDILYDAVYPTVLYYQDKLGGSGLGGIIVCGYDKDLSAQIGELRNKLGVPVKRADPANIEDMCKPSLGAVDFG